MLKTYIIRYKIADGNDRTQNGYVIQNNSNDKCSLGYDFSIFAPMNINKKYTGDVAWTGAVFYYSADMLASFSYTEI